MSERAFAVITAVGPGTASGTVLVTALYEAVDAAGTTSHHVGTAQVDGITYTDTPHDVREKIAAQIRTQSADPSLDVVFITSH